MEELVLHVLSEIHFPCQFGVKEWQCIDKLPSSDPLLAWSCPYFAVSVSSHDFVLLSLLLLLQFEKNRKAVK